MPKAKAKAKKKATPAEPCDPLPLVDFDLMSIEDFLIWSPLALKNFLFLRKKSTEGSFQELAAR